jgi:hypothetical protein
MGSGHSVVNADDKVPDDADVLEEHALEPDLEPAEDGLQSTILESDLNAMDPDQDKSSEVHSSGVGNGEAINVAPAPPQPTFEPTDQLLGQWNLACINAIIKCEEDFAISGSQQEDDTVAFRPPPPVVMDCKLVSLLRRISRLHADTHKVSASAVLDAGSLRSGKKPRATANPIKTLAARVAEVNNQISHALANAGDDFSSKCSAEGSDAGATDVDASESKPSTSIVQKYWHYPSSFQQPDDILRMGGEFTVKGFDVRILGATSSVVAVEVVTGYGLADVVKDALSCSGIGAHLNILMLVSVQRKRLRRDDSVAAAVGAPAVELMWEYVKGYSLEKMILSGNLYTAAHRSSMPLDSALRR